MKNQKEVSGPSPKYRHENKKYFKVSKKARREEKEVRRER
jgi:hypothetical protein